MDGGLSTNVEKSCRWSSARSAAYNSDFFMSLLAEREHAIRMAHLGMYKKTQQFEVAAACSFRRLGENISSARGLRLGRKSGFSRGRSLSTPLAGLGHRAGAVCRKEDSSNFRNLGGGRQGGPHPLPVTSQVETFGASVKPKAPKWQA